MKRLLLLSSVLACFAFLSIRAEAQVGWKQIYPTSVSLYHAVSADSVYAVVGDGDIMLSSDAGATWSKKGSIPWITRDTLVHDMRISNWLLDIHFLSSEKIILASTGYSDHKYGGYPSAYQCRIDISSDGGQAWRSAPVRGNYWGGGYGAIAHFHQSSPGIVIGFGPTGPNSAEYNTYMPARVISFNGDTVVELDDMDHMIYDDFAAKDSVLVLAGSNSAVIGQIQNAAWTPIAEVAAPIEYLDNGVLQSRNHRSTDNGVNWTLSSLQNIKSLYGSSFGVGWAQVNSTWHKTTDAGLTWRMIPEQLSLHKITSFDTSIAYALVGGGVGGTLVRTSDGGWKSDVSSTQLGDLNPAYPNPATTEVMVYTKSRWFNVVGEEIFPAFEESRDIYKYDVRELPRGVYILRSDDRISKVILH